MKKLICALAAAMIAVLCGAAALEVNGDFKILDRNGKPKNWERNGWSGYQPFAKFEILEENGARVLHIFDAAARGGFGWFYSARIDARAGGRFLITARVKGSGSGSFGLQLRDTGDKHIGQTERGGGFKLTEEWRDIAVTLDVVNSDRGETAKVLLTFTGTKGSELYISNITVAPEKSDTVGNAVFPREWTVFAPVAENTEVPTDRIPEKIGEISGRRVLLEGSRNMLDFRPFFPERKHRNCAWSFAVINVKNAEDYTVGAGADYYFALYVNGAKVLDTLEKGNAVGEPHFNNYLATVRLRPGENILAVKFLSGSGVFPRLCIGGANELRGMATALGISEYWEQDDYENACPRPGNPKLIREIVSPGWLTVSGQGVYSSGKFQLGKREYSLPLPASGKLFATGIRIQGLNGPAASACLSAGPLAAELATQNGVFEVRLIDGGKILRTLSLPRNALPADFILAGGRSHAYLNVASLADGKMRSLDAPVTHTGEEKFSVMLECSGDGTELTVDNYFTALAAPETKSNDVPFKIALDETFDPVKAGWPLVWHDEFDGDKVDLEKRWFMPIWLAKRDRVDYLTIQDGILHIRCELKSGEARPQTSGIRSRDTFQYGYFEARVRFTRQPGWWAAFWLVEEGKSMPTAGGSEIDIFEDYTTRRADRMIANNFHAFMGNVTKSYGYTFTLPDSFDDFYVIGCKWTPFEISTYLNGRLIRSTAAHSPWQSLTFDAINHAFPTSPSRVIVSGQVGSSGGKATGPFVEEYLVDYVRIYAYPKTHLPEISWKVVPDKNIVSTGTMLKFSADVRSNRDTQSSIAGVYLFDNGFLLFRQLINLHI